MKRYVDQNKERFPVALTRCYFCGEGATILLGRHAVSGPSKIEDELHDKVIDMTPCSKCEGYMKQGIIFLTIDDAKSEPGWNKDKFPNPYRTGGFFVLKEEAVERFMDGTMLEFAKKHRFVFIEHEAAEKKGWL